MAATSDFYGQRRRVGARFTVGCRAGGTTGRVMGYVESNLLPNEQITYRAKLHWIIYALPAIVFLIAILVSLVGGGWIAGSAIGIIGLVLFLPPWIKSSRSEFAITDKRGLIKVRLIRRHTMESL